MIFKFIVPLDKLINLVVSLNKFSPFLIIFMLQSFAFKIPKILLTAFIYNSNSKLYFNFWSNQLQILLCYQLLNSFICKSLFCSFYSYQSLPHQLDLSLIFFFFFLLSTGKSLGHFTGVFSLGYISIIHFHFLYVITYTVVSLCNKFLQWIRNIFFSAITFL